MFGLNKGNRRVKKRIAIYLIVAFGIVLGYLPLSSMLFRPEVVDAQCIQYRLDSCQQIPADNSCGCGVGCARVSQTQSGTWAGSYGINTWNTVLCVCT